MVSLIKFAGFRKKRDFENYVPQTDNSNLSQDNTGILIDFSTGYKTF